MAPARSSERKGQMAKHPKKRFAAFVDGDSDDDQGGGVMLRDFEDDCPFPSTSTPFGGTNSTASVPKTRSSDPRAKSTTASTGTSTAAPRRNTIQPIGTGRYSQHVIETAGGAPLNPPTGTSTSASVVNLWVCIARLAILDLSRWDMANSPLPPPKRAPRPMIRKARRAASRSVASANSWRPRLRLR